MKASKAAAAFGITVSLGLAACAQHAGPPPASPPATIGLPPPPPSTPPPPPPSTAAAPSTPSAPTAAPSSSPADPASVVRSFYAAINSHDYQAAWDLGGSHLGRPYADFAAGFADTATDVLSIDNVDGNTVAVHLHAVHTDGTTADYAGSYLVENGTITNGSLHVVATSAQPHTPVPSTPGGGPLGALNPAVTQSTIHSTICVPGWTATIRPPVNVTEQLKRQQLAASSAADKDPSHYEEDHIIPLELGGAPSDPANLRPVPLPQAQTDDRLENSLHRAVCDGSMTLTSAQTQITQEKAAETQP
ncbi:nuclear transport factor 2 family protein [Streptomyces sp. NPDC048419]|uniref:nuclear transport factor 2 family protein n=1 Tax=Streptomyces sp. NPDC048419 TaxID=3365547 RepID=UPI0037132537